MSNKCKGCYLLDRFGVCHWEKGEHCKVTDTMETKYEEALAKARAGKLLEEIFPELAESEDERIRNEIEQTLTMFVADNDSSLHPGAHYTVNEAIAWLEKQKEQKPLSPEEKMNHPLYLEGFDVGKEVGEVLAEQKSLTTEETELNSVAFLTEMGYTCIPPSKDGVIEKKIDALMKEQKPDIELVQRSWYMEGYHDREFGKEPKWIIKTGEGGPKYEKNERCGQTIEEQRPVDLQVKGDGVYKICPHCKERMVRDDSKVYTSMPPQYGYECPKCGEMEFDTVMYDNPEIEEQKLTEWSKNDTAFLNEITDFFENKTVKLQHDLDMYAHWLKSLPQRFNLQPKQEWSEEDEEMRTRIISILDNLGFEEFCKSSRDQDAEEDRLYHEEIDWLQSLRPQPKQEWSEEDKETINDAIKRVDELQYLGINCGKIREALMLKSLRPKPQWKPSEEQMKALNYAIAEWDGGKRLEGLYSLRNELKKL